MVQIQVVQIHILKVDIENKRFYISYLTRNTSTVLKSLDSLRGKITVFNLSNEENRDFLRIKGFMRTRPLNYISNSRKSKINIKVEGRLND